MKGVLLDREVWKGGEERMKKFVMVSNNKRCGGMEWLWGGGGGGKAVSE